MDQQALQELIALFLKINPTPSDEQFHSLARAVGTDPETLESVSYGMLSEDEDLLDDAEIEATSTHSGNDGPIARDDTSVFSTSPSTSLEYGDGDHEEGESTHSCEEPVIPTALMASACQRVLANSVDSLEDPMADPDQMTLQDVANNDGDPTDDDLGLQQETYEDGVDIADKGAGLVNNPSDVLTDDGVPDYSVD